MFLCLVILLILGFLAMAVYSMRQMMRWHDRGLELLYGYSPELWDRLGKPLGYGWMPPDGIKPAFSNVYNLINGMNVFAEDKPEFALIEGLPQARARARSWHWRCFLLMFSGFFGVPVCALLWHVLVAGR